MICSVVLLVVSFGIAGTLGFELMPEVDQGTISVSIEMRPGLKVEEADKIIRQVEEIVTEEADLDSYMVSYGGSGLSLGGSAASLSAYLKSDRQMSTYEIVDKWKEEMNRIPDCNITVESSSMMSMMSTGDGIEIILQSPQLDDLKDATDQLKTELTKRSDLIKVPSDLENSAPVLKVKVDPLKASAEGVSPASVGAILNSSISGAEATTLDVDGDNLSVMVEYPEDTYDTLDKVEGIMIPISTGGSVALTDVAEVVYEDSPSLPRNRGSGARPFPQYGEKTG